MLCLTNVLDIYSQKYYIYCIYCKIVEVNERLVAEPELVRTHPGTEGFVAMVLPKIPDGLKELRERLECVEEEDSVGQTGRDEVAGSAIS